MVAGDVPLDPTVLAAADPPGSAVSRRVSAWLVMGLVALQGATINLMPMMFGPLARDFQASMRQQGQLQSVFLLGSLAGLITTGYATELIGTGRSAALAVGLTVIGALACALADDYALVLVGGLFLGLGNSWILGAYSAVITRQFPETRARMFMWATAVFAASATVSTTLFGALIDKFGRWDAAFFALAAISLLGACGFWAALRADPASFGGVNRRLGNRRVPEVSRARGLLAATRYFLAGGLLNQRLFWLLGFLVVIDVVVSGGVVAWTGRFFQQHYGLNDRQVGTVISASSAGVLAGRVVMAIWISGRFSDRATLAWCYGCGMLAYGLMLWLPGYHLGLGLMFLYGACIAAQAPVMYTIASRSFGERGATAIPLIDAVGTVGGLAAPTLIGILGDRYGLRTVLCFVPLGGALLVAVLVVWIICRPEDRGADRLATARKPSVAP